MSAGFSKFRLVAYIMRSAVITKPAIALGRAVRTVMDRSFSPRLPPPPEVRSVLVIALDHLGDLILSSGYFRDVRKSFPAAKITLLTDKRFVSYVEQCPYVDETLGFDVSGSQFKRAFHAPFRAFQFARRELWKRGYDLALNHRWDSDTVNAYLIGLFSHARVHAGYSNISTPRKKTINRGYNGAFSHLLESTELIHESERGRELLKFLGLETGDAAAEIWPLPDDENFVARHLPRDRYEPLIALGIGASQRRRQWPIDHYRKLVEAILESWPSAHFLVVGNRDDRSLAEELREDLGGRLINFAGECTVGQSGLFLARCVLYIGSDSGPMHMAAAAGVSVIELSCHPVTGANTSAHSPVRYHPLGVPYIVMQPVDFMAPCRYECLSSVAHCMLGISVDQVVKATGELLVGRLASQV